VRVLSKFKINYKKAQSKIEWRNNNVKYNNKSKSHNQTFYSTRYITLKRVTS